MKKIFYPQSVVAATKSRKLTSSAFRQGVLTLDTSKNDVVHYKHNGLSNGYSELHYIFDTLAHIDYAKMQDAEDWEDSQGNYGDIIHLNELFVEVFSRLEEDMLSLPEPDQQRVYTDVYIDIYGVGNRYITTRFRVYTDEMSSLLDNKHMMIQTNGLPSFVYNTKNIQPNSYHIKKRFCPHVVKYLSEGLNLL